MWIDHIVTPEFASTQAQLLFMRALEKEGLVNPDDTVGEIADREPVLLAWSDNGTQMTSEDTRQFMALVAIWQHRGRPGTPTDQAHIESFFSHLVYDWPHLDRIEDPVVLNTELARVQTEYNSVRLHAGIGYVNPPTTNAKAKAPPSAEPAPPASHEPAATGSTPTASNHPNRPHDLDNCRRQKRH